MITKKSPFVLLIGACLAACHNDEVEQPAKPKPVEPKPAVADFTLPPKTEATIGVTFQNQSQEATRYVWDFGDGSKTSQEQHPAHTYATAGTYPVKLKAYGATKVDSVTKSYTVVPYEIFVHSPVHFAGVYACKVISGQTDPNGITTSRRLPDKDITITQQAPNIILWDSYKLTYDQTKTYASGTTAHLFSAPMTQDLQRLSVGSSFYAVGDSGVFRVSTLIGHTLSFTTYYGKRRL